MVLWLVLHCFKTSTTTLALASGLGIRRGIFERTVKNAPRVTFKHSQGVLLFSNGITLRLSSFALVISHQYPGYFRTGKLKWQVFTSGQHVTNFCSGKHYVIVLTVGTVTHHNYLIALFAQYRVITLENLNLHGSLRDIIKDSLCIKTTIIVAHSSMVATNDQDRSAPL